MIARWRLGGALCLAVALCCRPTNARHSIPDAALTPPGSPNGGSPETGAAARVFGDSGAPGAATGIPAVPPRFALDAGYMPLASAGVNTFRARHPTYDGRGVLIGVLDSGIDPSAPGLQVTAAGAPKILDLRDFSSEGKVVLAPVSPSAAGTITVGGRTESGTGRIARLATGSIWYGGEFKEGDDRVPVIVARASDGWIVFLDANSNGSFEDDAPLHDYRAGHETATVGSRPLVVAANLSEQNGVPLLDFVFDNAGHGTHVAGVAAGRDLFQLAGFDGVAPGAQLLGLKVTDNGRGGVATTGSIVDAMHYAARFAEERGLRLVLNLSFAVRMPYGSRSTIDSLVDAFLVAHPAVIFTVAAGNDGPGVGTLGSPAAADLALAIGSTLPLAFTRTPDAAHPVSSDLMGWWSARGGPAAKPDLTLPGFAFSTVPRFATGEELQRGTSVGAPYAAGLAACLLSGLAQEGRRVSAVEIAAALRATAVPFPGTSFLDRGAGEPRLEAAYRWLEAGHQGAAYAVRSETGSAALQSGSPSVMDTTVVFRVRHLQGLRAAQFALRATVPWISVASRVTAGPVETIIPVRVSLPQTPVPTPGLYTGSVTARNPSDTVAGALFTLLCSLVIPYDLGTQPLTDRDRAVMPGRVQRYFLRVPAKETTLRVAVDLRGSDSLTTQAAVRLYEPGGRALSGAPSSGGARDRNRSVTFQVGADETLAGIYELDVVAPPLTGVTASVRAELAPFQLRRNAGGVEATNASTATVSGTIEQSLIGASRRYAVNQSGAAPETLMVRVPEWAVSGVFRVTVPDSTWRSMSGLALSLSDSGGRRIAAYPLYNATSSAILMLPGAVPGHTLRIELYPAFARANDSRTWEANLLIQFLLPAARDAGSPSPLSLVAGERLAIPSASLTALSVPAGYAPLVETRIRPSGTTILSPTAVLEFSPGVTP